MLAVAALRYGLPSNLTWGPDWTMAAVVPSLLVPTVLAHQTGRHRMNEILGYTLVSVVTLDLIVSLALLISRLPNKQENSQQLLIAAAGIWSCNVLVFASWYWRLDGGGPNRRDSRGHHDHETGAFLFPQMTLPHSRRWKPGFVDYLFLAFNTSTAFSPTDVPVLSRWAKMLMMLQSSISLSTLAIIAGRAVNAL